MLQLSKKSKIYAFPIPPGRSYFIKGMNSRRMPLLAASIDIYHAYRGEHPPYCTAVVLCTYDQKSIKWLLYEKLCAVQMANGISVFFTIGNRPKTDKTASKLIFLYNMSYNFYLDKVQ